VLLRFCGGVVVFLCLFFGGLVFVVVWLCFCGGVVVFLSRVFVLGVVLWLCFCGCAVVLL